MTKTHIHTYKWTKRCNRYTRMCIDQRNILYHTCIYLGSPRNLCYYVFDHEVKALSVAGGVVVELDRTTRWPSLGRTITLNNSRGLAIK